jgi:hypothetical protein
MTKNVHEDGDIEEEIRFDMIWYLSSNSRVFLTWASKRKSIFCYRLK